MPDSSWKAFERVVASFFGTSRNPLSSRWSRHDTESDSLHPRLYIEAKRDKSYLGKRLLDLIDDTWACAKKEGKVPVLAFKRHNKQGFYLLIKAEDLGEIANERIATVINRHTNRRDVPKEDARLHDLRHLDVPARTDSSLGHMARARARVSRQHSGNRPSDNRLDRDELQ